MNLNRCLGRRAEGSENNLASKLPKTEGDLIENLSRCCEPGKRQFEQGWPLSRCSPPRYFWRNEPTKLLIINEFLDERAKSRTCRAIIIIPKPSAPVTMNASPIDGAFARCSKLLLRLVIRTRARRRQSRGRAQRLLNKRQESTRRAAQARWAKAKKKSQ